MKMRFVTSLSALVLSACTDPAGTVTEPDRASLRAIHLAPGAPAVDLFVDSEATPSYRALSYQEVTPYLDLPAGRNLIDVAASGQRITTIEVNLEARRFYTTIVLGDRSLTFDDMNEGLRIVHASAELGAISLWDPADGSNLGQLSYGQAALAPKLARLGVGDAIFQIPPGDGTIEVFALGGADDLTIKSYYSNGSSQNCMEEPKDPAKIRVLHLSPDAPNVDVYANGTRAVENLEFGRSTAFLTVPSDDYRFEVTAAGDTNAVLTVDLGLEPNAAYTAVAFGPLAQIGALAIPENLDAPAGGIRIRIVHAAFGVGQVDVIDEKTGLTILDDVDFGAVGPALEAPAGTHTIGLDLDDDHTSELIFDLPELIAGASANLFAVADDSGAFILVQLLDGTTVRVNPRHEVPQPKAFLRAVHLSPDAPAVNAFVDGDQAVTGLLFKQATGALEVNADARIDVSAGALEEAVLGADLELTAGASYSVAVFDRIAWVKALVIEDDLTPPPAGLIRLRAIHTASGVGDVNILSGGNVLYAGLAFGTAGDAIELPAGQYTLGLDVNDDHQADLWFDLPHLVAGTIANAFAVTDADGNASLFAVLADGTTADVPAR